MRAIFVTGTDTGVGKTVITGLLARFLLKRGYNTITQKWIQTGNKNFPEDINTHLKLMQMRKKNIEQYLPYISPYVFKFPSSPHLAAKLKKKRIDATKIKESFKFLKKKFNSVIVEGSGGSLVPFNEKKLIIDITKDLNVPVLIVAGNKLGAINHTLLTIGAMRARKLKIAGIIFNNLNKNVNKTILKDNPRIVKNLTGIKILGTLPWSNNKKNLYKSFTPIGKNLLKNYE